MTPGWVENLSDGPKIVHGPIFYINLEFGTCGAGIWEKKINLGPSNIYIWRGVKSGLNMTATRGQNSDGHKKGGIRCFDGSTCCHTSYWHDAPSRLTFRHPWMKLYKLMSRFLGYIGRFSLPLFWVTFCILWLCDENTLNILVPGVSICRNLYEQSTHLPFTYPAKI